MGEHTQRHENFLFTSKLASLQEFINVFEKMCQCCSSRNGNVVLLRKKNSLCPTYFSIILKRRYVEEEVGVKIE